MPRLLVVHGCRRRVEVIWGVPLHGVTVVDVVGEMILGKTQHKDTVEFLVRTDGWACYKWPKVGRLGSGSGSGT